MTNRARGNVVANLVGTICQAAMPLIFNVAYYRLLGPDSYGMIAIFSTLFAVSTVTDFGISATLLREIALRCNGESESVRSSLRALVFTTQSLQLSISVVFGGIIVLSSKWLSLHWIKSATLAPELISTSMTLIAIVIAIQQPRGLFIAGLNGLQRQVTSNVILVLGLAVRGVSTIAVLDAFDGSILAFFATQLIVSILETSACATALWMTIRGSGGRTRFDLGLVSEVKRFALGSGGTMLIAMFLMFGDKIALSKLLTLADFGSYSLIVLVCSALPRIVAAFASAYSPVFTALHGSDHRLLGQTYLRVCETVSILLCLGAAVIICFSHDVLLSLTGKPNVAAGFAVVLAISATGTLFNCQQQLPHALQTASGWTSLALITNAVALVFYLPALIFLAPIHGVIVPPVLWLISSALQFPFFIQLTHRRLLPGLNREWLRRVVVLPTLAIFLPVMMLAALLPQATNLKAAIIHVVLALIVGLAGSAFLPFVQQVARAAWMARFAGRRFVFPPL